MSATEARQVPDTPMGTMEIVAFENGVCMHYAGPEDGTFEAILDVLMDRYGHYEQVKPAEARDIRQEVRRLQKQARSMGDQSD